MYVGRSSKGEATALREESQTLFLCFTHWWVWVCHPKSYLGPYEGKTVQICFYVWGIDGCYCVIKGGRYGSNGNP